MFEGKRQPVIVVAFVVGVVLAIAGVVVVFSDPKHVRDLEPVADYDSYYFEGVLGTRGQVFEAFYPHSAIEARKRSATYVQVPDGRVFLIWELPEDAISGVLTTDPGGGDLGGTYYGNPDRSNFLYVNGQLTSACVASNLRGFRIGPTINGPFVELPVTRARLLEVFGEPAKWRHRGRGATGA